MKSFVAVILAISSVSALGSGPYLPSGWRPKGPAFFLPGEVQKPAVPADNPLKETLLFGSEASSASNTEALREYGPPKTAENVIQALPDVVTETTFYVEKNAEVVEQDNTEVLEATTEAQIAEAQPTVIYESIADIELQTEVTTYADEVKEIQATVEEKVEKLVEEKIEEIGEEKLEEIVEEKKVEEKLEQVVEEEVKVQEEVQNVAETLANLENEIKKETADIKVQEGSGSANVPEGFLEYGPPGFREYGPPKGGALLRTAAFIQEPSNSVDARRRRFSPKFRATKAKRIH